MQKWEYLVIRGEYSNGRFRPHFVNEQELTDWRKISLVSFLNQLGDEGWELVGSLGFLTGGPQNKLLFKRPKP